MYYNDPNLLQLIYMLHQAWHIYVGNLLAYMRHRLSSHSAPAYCGKRGVTVFEVLMVPRLGFCRKFFNLQQSNHTFDKILCTLASHPYRFKSEQFKPMARGLLQFHHDRIVIATQCHQMMYRGIFEHRHLVQSTKGFV